MFNETILQQFGMCPIDEWKTITGCEDIDFYITFLIQTDYIINKIVEAQVLGVQAKDYSEILRCRAYAREQINILRKEN